jgi:hypothetical protein
MPRIRSLRPNVTREEAVEQISSGLSGTLRTAVVGPLRSIADFHIPFRLFQVEITNAGKSETRILGIDVLSGLLDLYHFERLPDQTQVVCLDTRNCAAACLDDARASELVVEKVRRMIFRQGFFRMRDLRIHATVVPGDLHIPYWVGFHGNGNRARVTVIDAVRRRFEGAKVKRMLEDWLAAN